MYKIQESSLMMTVFFICPFIYCVLLFWNRHVVLFWFNLLLESSASDMSISHSKCCFDLHPNVITCLFIWTLQKFGILVSFAWIFSPSVTRQVMSTHYHHIYMINHCYKFCHYKHKDYLSLTNKEHYFSMKWIFKSWIQFCFFSKFYPFHCVARDYDGKVTPEEVASAAMYLKDHLGKEGIQDLISNLSKDRGLWQTSLSLSFYTTNISYDPLVGLYVDDHG